MATIVLSSVGNALLPGVGGIIGGVIGGYIDSNFLFPQPDQKGPRLDDLKFGSGTEGTPINLILGTERVAGTCIWKSKLIESENEEGKGGPSITSYSYSVDCAFGICEGLTSGIYRVAKIFANGNLLYDADADVAISSNQIACTRTSVFTWNNWLQVNVETVYQDLTSPSGGPDLSKLRSGRNCVVAGFANANNNGTFRVLSSSMDTVSGNSTARLRNANAVTATSSPTITVTQDLPEFSPNKASSFTFYTGTSTQTADPLIESYEGSGNVPGYRGLAYVVIEGLQLADFGNTMPQLNFLVEQVNGAKTIAEAITDLCGRTVRPSTDFDVTALTGNLRGYNVRGAQPVGESLKPILLAYDILTQEKGGVLFFFPRTAAETVEVESTEVGAHEPGSEVPRPFDVVPLERTKLPVLVTVAYVDHNFDNQRGSQPYRGRRGLQSSDNVLAVDLPLVLTPSEAQDIARRLYWTAHANHQKVMPQLPPSLMTTQENDRIHVTTTEAEWTVLLGKVDRGVNHLVVGEGVTEEDDVLTFTGSAAAEAHYTRPVVYTTPEMEMQPIDIGPLRTEDEEVPGWYDAASFLDSSQLFLGGGIYVSDDDATYELDSNIESEATMGRTTNLPSSVGISAAYWDRKTVLNVKLYNGSLASNAETDVMNGRNRALWGREVIGFATASLQGDGSYNVSVLLRGLRDTDDAMLGHVAGEPFVQLDGGGIRFHSVPYSDIDRTRFFKPVALGGIVSQFTAIQQTLECNTLRHFRPTQFVGVRDSVTSDLALTWVRSTRAVWRALSTAVPPLLDTLEKYEIDVMDDTDTTVLRTITITAATTTTYTAAQQTTDFGATHANAHLRLYQVHTITGRSKAITLVA